MLLVAPDAGVPGLAVHRGFHGRSAPGVRGGWSVLVRDPRERPSPGTWVAEQRRSKGGLLPRHTPTLPELGMANAAFRGLACPST
jgi:hypothetical protein